MSCLEERGDKVMSVSIKDQFIIFTGIDDYKVLLKLNRINSIQENYDKNKQKTIIRATDEAWFSLDHIDEFILAFSELSDEEN